MGREKIYLTQRRRERRERLYLLLKTRKTLCDLSGSRERSERA
jgi:hypothetical protein